MHFGSLALAGLIGLLLASVAQAHESRPAYLELAARDAGVFDLQWRRPARGELVLAMQPALPAHCAPLGRRSLYHQPDMLVERWVVDCGATGLAGHVIRINGLEATQTDVLVRLILADGATHTHILRPNHTSFTVMGQPSRWQVATEYTRLGFEHILGGIDHLLFVLALMMLIKDTRRLIVTITAFTIAHSLTLAAATLGWVQVPQQPVEAVIALSIVLVAGEILHARQGRAGIAHRWPWMVAFAFGLLHGFGFAGALSEVGLQQGQISVALLFFNLGVEAGQLLFVTAIYGMTISFRRIWSPLPRSSELLAPYAIGSVALMWVIQRVTTF